jgi:hypothetical protein
MTVCALCRRESELRTSHIIPAFVFRWLRETSATGFLRSGRNPQKRTQDGLKLPLLCEECEQRFSRLERRFANEMFYPMQRDKVSEVDYANWFLKFCVSISWRVLTYAVQQGQIGHLSQQQSLEGIAALARWAQFLLDEVSNPGRFEQRLVVLGAIAKAPVNRRFQPNSNRYFMRGLDIDLASSASSAFTYAKIGPFSLFGMIQSHERWQGTKVNASAGTVGPREYELPQSLFEYWMDRAERQSRAYRKISAAHQEKLEAAIRLNPERFLRSGTFEAMVEDVSMFGPDAFWNPG